MADWTNLPNTAVGVGGLPSGTTVTALRDNPIAIVKGAPGAPRPASPEKWFQAGNQFSGLSPGENDLPVAAFSGFFSQTSTSSTTFVSAGTATITARATGTLRFNAEKSTTVTGVIELRKNGVAVFTSPNDASPSFFVDVASAVGDVFEWFVRRTGGTASNTVTIMDFSVGANDNLIYRGIPAKLSEVQL